jgi:DNA-binding PadR family transcriptional regulator
MATPHLTTTASVVLGLVSEREPATAYDLKAFADVSIGYFWDFPRSQIYAEVAKLVEAGLLDEEQEESGRRRRHVRLTPAGRAALAEWVAHPVDTIPEIRDRGLLQLFFSRSLPDSDVAELARHQVSAHQSRLAEYEGIRGAIGDGLDDPTRTALELGLRLERLYVEFWTEVTHVH